MKILRCFAGLLFICSFLIFPSCNKSTVTAVLGDWRKSAPFKGTPRAGSVSFVIGNKAYVGLGHDGEAYHNDFFAWDEDQQFWEDVADFPGQSREQAIAFSIGGKGYLGTGYNRDDNVYFKDFWEYDPGSNQWTQLNDFSGDARANAVGFDDGTNGYLGTGYNINYYGDFWKYDSGTDTWTEIPSYKGDKREQAMTMTIAGKTYLFGGQNNGSFTYDIWEFNPTAEAQSRWTDRTPLTTDAQYNNFRVAVNRYDAVAFTLSNKGYISTGSNGSILNTTYQYDPSNQTYTLMTPFERASRSQAVSFVVGNKAYVATGMLSSSRQSHFDDMMEFRPLDQFVVNN